MDEWVQIDPQPLKLKGQMQHGTLLRAMGNRVVVAMSGGVDSSVAAALLQEEGYDVVGITLRLWPDEEEGHTHPCCLSEGVKDAQAVALRLGIPHYVLNMEEPFLEHVVDYFCDEYARGRTPNPCLACNRVLKFHLLLMKVMALGASHLVTGHYCRVISSPGGFRLLRGVDEAKDQSYFLYALGQQEMAHVLFPVGALTKAEVRRYARRRGLPVADKGESQDICFVSGDYRTFVSKRLSFAPGPMVDTGGGVVGEHSGVALFTVGQRRGLGIGGGPVRYVVRLEPDDCRVVVGDEVELYSSRLRANNLCWTGTAPDKTMDVLVRVRHLARLAPATVTPAGSGVMVEFALSQRAVAPGQAVVFYAADNGGEEVLGGGTIDRVGV
jgi:tRNA-specific 2-thiouridylase